MTKGTFPHLLFPVRHAPPQLPHSLPNIIKHTHIAPSIRSRRCGSGETSKLYNDVLLSQKGESFSVSFSVHRVLIGGKSLVYLDKYFSIVDDAD